jgi:lipopolysaccharide transport system ATP-binding protein
MAIAITQLGISAPDGAVIGVIGETGSGVDAVLEEARKAGAITFDHTQFATADALERLRMAGTLFDLRRSGGVAFLASHEDELLRRLVDEIWWLRDGKLAGKGDPAETISKYQHHVARQLRALGDGRSAPLDPSMRRGDGRARLIALETLTAEGRPTMVWTSGEDVMIRTVVEFAAAVDDPVVGIMIRTRIGFEVYGTNTELEKLKLGPCAAGDQREIAFRFRCDLCPQEYTITAASHDPDGVWHDWLEDAVAFKVADTRHTAGVANLRAAVSLG